MTAPINNNTTRHTSLEQKTLTHWNVAGKKNQLLPLSITTRQNLVLQLITSVVPGNHIALWAAKQMSIEFLRICVLFPLICLQLCPLLYSQLPCRSSDKIPMSSMLFLLSPALKETRITEVWSLDHSLSIQVEISPAVEGQDKVKGNDMGFCSTAKSDMVV